MKHTDNKFICWLWSKVWSLWLQEGEKVIMVKGWNCALITHGRSRQTIFPCVWDTIKNKWQNRSILRLPKKKYNGPRGWAEGSESPTHHKTRWF
jgi:hypothetical protein